jgi:DNA-binding response OmpR family regulator
MKPFATCRVTIPETTASIGGRRPCVLFVSDDQDLRAVSARVLEREGYRVISAPHAGHALLACLSGEPIDVLVSDLCMGDGSGPALAERLRRYSAELRTLYLGQPGTTECDAVVVRPFTRDDLVARLDAVLATVSA